ncbi:unnamed protein product [Spirodela intermedia]|uniref:Elp3/MiaA/NifB-like radical SAM core domain-containing protein n=1 Tax=Spirodela intermedia TaxID=51605 RepID=A0A7I8IPT7_SPIIN|nr:unnamed protein product [Spirodela intermedia]CAA6659584.1 unnamed protein product [Spirodela intermedia]
MAVSPAVPPRSAYVHLPFCRRRCHYCDFPIVALGSPLSSPGNYDDDPRVADYVSLVLREIAAATGGAAPQDYPPLETIFFGGGTPSLVPPRMLGVSAGAEISIEMDPGTFDAQRLRDMLRTGVNRVSLGVQAFQEELLMACGRAHGVAEAHQAVEITAAMWEETLKLAAASSPAHVSVYDLQIHTGEFPLPSENQSAEFYRMASEMLAGAGYEHYEISSYAKPGFQCRHNLTYWQNRPFHGFGLGAASYTSGARFTRPRRMKEYASYVSDLEGGAAAAAAPPPPESADGKDAAMDVVMLSLRTARGLDMKELAAGFGGELAAAICRAFELYVDSGHVVAMDEEMAVIPASSFRRREELAGGGVAFLRLSDPEDSSSPTSSSPSSSGHLSVVLAGPIDHHRTELIRPLPASILDKRSNRRQRRRINQVLGHGEEFLK